MCNADCDSLVSIVEHPVYCITTGLSFKHNGHCSQYSQYLHMIIPSAKAQSNRTKTRILGSVCWSSAIPLFYGRLIYRIKTISVNLLWLPTWNARPSACQVRKKTVLTFMVRLRDKCFAFTGPGNIYLRNVLLQSALAELISKWSRKTTRPEERDLWMI